MNQKKAEQYSPEWFQLFSLIREQFPYSKISRVQVRNGAVVSYEKVQHTMLFRNGSSESLGHLPEAFDDQWRRFWRFCQEFQNGILGELHFTDGRPVLVLMEQAGRDLEAEKAARS